MMVEVEMVWMKALLAASISTFYDMVLTYLFVEILGFIELNPLYYLGGYPLFLLFNLLFLGLIFCLEKTFMRIGGREYERFKSLVIVASIFRAGLVTGVPLSSILTSLYRVV